MRKKVLLSLALMMGALMPAMAETLTVFEGTNTSTQVPIYGYYVDYFQKSEYVIPAPHLATMEAGAISSLQWTATSPASGSWGDAVFQVYVKEVNDSTITSFYGQDGATLVYEGSIDPTQNTITIPFNEPYLYEGGNLLVGVWQIVKGSYKGVTFGGKSVTGSSVQGHSSSSLDQVTANARHFIPTTTFTYTPNAGPIYKKPTNLEATNITANGATITWTPGSTETTWNVEYKKADAEDWTPAGVANTPSITLEDLSNGTAYDVRVQGDYGEGNVSAWASASFVTVMCDDDEKGEITLTLTDSYGDGWNGNQIQIICQDNGVIIGTYTIETGGKDEPIIYNVPLCYGFTYDIMWIGGSFGSECGFVITGPDGVIYEHTAGTAPTSGILTSFVMEMVTCPRPKDLAASNITMDGATLSWTPANEEQDLWQVIYAAGNVAADAINMAPVEVNEATLTLTELTPGTLYSAYVRSKCGEQDMSSWSEVCTFTTMAADVLPTNLAVENVTANSAEVSWNGVQESYNLRYRVREKPNGFFEDFEGIAMETLPEGWTVIDADGDGYNWYGICNTEANQPLKPDANGNPRCFGNACATSASYMSVALHPDNWIITPQIELKGQLSVWLRGQDPNYAGEKFAIYLSTTGNTIDDFTTELVNETTAQAVLTEYTYDLSQYEGQMGYIAIRHFDVSDMFRLNMDNILVGEMIPAGEWVTVENVTSPYTIKGLTPETDYEVQVQGVYNEQIMSDWTASANFTTLEQENVTYYVAGGFNGWDALEITEEGATFDVVEDPDDVESKEFKIKTPTEDGEWLWLGGVDENGVGYFEVTEGMMADGIELTLDDTGSNFRLPGSGNYTITLAQGAKAPVEGVKIVVKKNNQTPTAITDIYGKPVKSVKYVNIAGMESDKPFDGVNIVVTTFTDGTQVATKVIK